MIFMKPTLCSAGFMRFGACAKISFSIKSMISKLIQYAVCDIIDTDWNGPDDTMKSQPVAAQLDGNKQRFNMKCPPCVCEEKHNVL